jgi:protein-S-isoprenylcysteine O-methyltransferase Ste14
MFQGGNRVQLSPASRLAADRVPPVNTDSKAGDPMTGLAKAAGANVVQIPPPLYYGAALAGGLILQRFLPLDVPFRSVTAPAGAVALALGIALNLGGVIGVATHKTTIVPHHHVTALVTTGVYRFSRNPMYTGLAVAVAGASLVLGSWWPLILLPGALLAVRRLVIDPEERYLTQRFGSIYDEYRKRVPRWL